MWASLKNTIILWLLCTPTRNQSMLIRPCCSSMCYWLITTPLPFNTPVVLIIMPTYYLPFQFMDTCAIVVLICYFYVAISLKALLTSLVVTIYLLSALGNNLHSIFELISNEWMKRLLLKELLTFQRTKKDNLYCKMKFNINLAT